MHRLTRKGRHICSLLYFFICLSIFPSICGTDGQSGGQTEKQTDKHAHTRTHLTAHVNRTQHRKFGSVHRHRTIEVTIDMQWSATTADRFLSCVFNSRAPPPLSPMTPLAPVQVGLKCLFASNVKWSNSGPFKCFKQGTARCKRTDAKAMHSVID